MKYVFHKMATSWAIKLSLLIFVTEKSNDAIHNFIFTNGIVWLSQKYSTMHVHEKAIWCHWLKIALAESLDFSIATTLYFAELADSKNSSHLLNIESSIFLLSLDKSVEMLSNVSSDRRTVELNQVHHGGGSHSNSINRWFDKILQVRRHWATLYRS